MSSNLYRNPAIPVTVALLLTAPSLLAQTARFLGEDRATKGNWKNVYGNQGYQIPSDGTLNPSYGSASIAGSLTYSWATSTADVRALQKIAGVDRAATTWYSPVSGSFDMNFTFSDSAPHRVVIYCLDWEGSSRIQTIEVRSAATNALLDSQVLSNFSNGVYLRWNLSGNIKLKVINTGPVNAVVGGLFFDPATAEPAWWAAYNVKTGAATNNRGPANIGQARWMASRAVEAIRSHSPSLATEIDTALIGDGKPLGSIGWAAPANAAEFEKQKAPLLVGQLKAIATPFYDKINGVAPEWLAAERVANLTETGDGIFPWTNTNAADDNNKGVATIGQLKAVFSLHFTDSYDGDAIPDFYEAMHGGQGTPLDQDGNGLPDQWEIDYFGGVGIYGGNADVEPDGALNVTEYQQGTNPLKRDHPAVGLVLARSIAN